MVVGTVFVEDAKVPLVAAMDWTDVVRLDASWDRGRTITIIVVIIVITLIITIISSYM